MNSSTAPTERCEYCGRPLHQGYCPRIRAVEYHENGTVKRAGWRRCGVTKWNRLLIFEAIPASSASQQ